MRERINKFNRVTTDEEWASLLRKRRELGNTNKHFDLGPISVKDNMKFTIVPNKIAANKTPNTCLE